MPTEEQLQAWKAFLEVERRIAEARQFYVPFISHNYGTATRLVTFELAPNSATLDGFAENSLDEDEFWQRAKQARREDIKLCETIARGKDLRYSRQLGSVEEVNSSSHIIRVRLMRELADSITQGHHHLPAKGFLFFEPRGEIAQIRRKEKALEDLKRSNTQNPYLGRFFFDVSLARAKKINVELQPQELLFSSANPEQKASVEAVLAAPDLVLIQGPPGTGKTTVIAEICYQVARRNGRTLIASQANLAVDNALSRLVHNPVIRAVRKGKAEKVGEEGIPFLEDQVIGTWLQNTATDCEQSLSKRHDNIEVFQQLLASSTRFTTYLRAEEAFEEEQNIWQQRQATLESASKGAASDYAKATQEQHQVELLKARLADLLKIAPTVNWDDADVVDLLKCLQPYAIGDSSVRSFIEQVKEAIALAAELGFKNRPARGAFGLSAWLCDRVASEITGELNRAIAQAYSIVTLITEPESDSQTNKQSLQENHQQNLDLQHSLQQKISNLQNRQSQISLTISELEAWQLDNSQIYNSFKKCLQERRNFVDQLISLPANFLTLVPETSPLPWQPNLDQCRVKVNELIDKYKEYDQVHKIARELEQRLPSPQSLDESVAPATDTLRIQSLDSRQVLSQLEQLAESALAQNNQSEIEAIRRQINAIKRQIPPHFEPTLRQMVIEVVNSVFTSAHYLLNQLSAETEQERHLLETELNQLQKLLAEQKLQISAIQNQPETESQKYELKLTKVIPLLQELAQFPQIPNNIQGLIRQYQSNPANILAQTPQFLAQVDAWKTRTERLETLISSLAPFDILSIVQNLLELSISSLRLATETSQQQLEEAQNQVREIEEQLQQQKLSESLLAERTWWQLVWEAIPQHLKPTVPTAGMFSPDFLRHVKTQFDVWQQEITQEETYLNRYQPLVEDWISRIRNPSEQDHNELRQIYLDNANVIGITCSQAASRDFSQEFKSFDVVIIDEVSKCTPPELLIPALKGKKLVMVGDHRQLPPMLDNSTLEEVAEKIGSPREQLGFLETSLFKSQFESAHESIKQMLTTQYRMHPTIMGAINQFYQDKLQCGIIEADTRRAHNLAGAIIQEQHHLLWVKTPLESDFAEEREGTSLFNLREVEIIERLCQQMESVWAAKVAKGEPKKEIAVITFYGVQLRKIDERLEQQLFPSLHIRTGTVDRFQGMERAVVIVSMVRNNSEKDVGFAKKPERVNVAFSRAQELLIIVGCHALFTQARGVGSMYSNVADVVRLHEGFIDAAHILSESN